MEIAVDKKVATVLLTQMLMLMNKLCFFFSVAPLGVTYSCSGKSFFMLQHPYPAVYCTISNQT